MTLAVLGAAVYGAVVVYAASREATLAPVVASLGGFGAVLLLFVLVRGADDLLGWSLALAGVGYAMSLIAHGTHVDEAAPLVATALLVCGELAAWSLDERWAIRREPGLLRSRGLAVAGLSVAGLGASALVLSLSAVPAGGGLGWTIVGAVAAVLVVGLAVRAAKRRTV